MTVAGETHRCPPHEVLAAFVDAKLPRNQVVALTEHLTTCAECRFVVESASELQAEEEEDNIAPRRGRAWQQIAVAAVIGAGLLLTPMAKTTYVRETAIRELASVQLQKRLIEPRLTGSIDVGAWSVTRGKDDPEQQPTDQMSAEGKAAQLLEDTKNDRSAAGAHARGIAWLVLRDADRAIAELTTATQKKPDDAQAWSDFAAAHLLKKQYKEAIDAANRALALDPKLSEARFNKALATDGLEKPAESIRAWNDYLKHDPAAPWVHEAKTKKSRWLPPSTSSDQ